MPSSPILRLLPGLQSYDWGKTGRTSLAAQFAERCLQGTFQADESKPYAELWMGTHPNVPSKVDNELLATILKNDPEFYLGNKIMTRYPSSASDGSLPFLFKILSIKKALSIQAHPDKQLAERLNKERPEVYKDDNHKPEMAIALTPFRGFCGFLPLSLLLLLLSTVPEVRSLIGDKALEQLAEAIDEPLPTKDSDAPQSLVQRATRDSSNQASSPETTSTQKAALRAVFEALMTASDADVADALHKLLARYNSSDSSCRTSFERTLTPLVIELEQQYPSDVGVLCCFVLNVVELQAGEAMFLKADEPHAYISGDIVECMATSDNVVRAGLTPKLRDVPTLVSMLTYNAAPAHAQLLEPTPFQGKQGRTSLLYDPPIDEFSVVKIQLQQSASERHAPVDGPSIVIVTEGSGSIKASEQDVEFARGDVLFIAAGQQVEYHGEEKHEQVVLYRAFVEA